MSLSLVPTELCHSTAHLLVIVNAEALLLRHACKLHILRIQLLLHNLLQCLQNQCLSFGQGQGPVVFVLQLGLCAFTSGANGLGIVTVESTRGLGVISGLKKSS